MTYTYADASHKHAVTATSNGWSFQFDANGNMVQRTIGGTVYNLTYDEENRLTSVSGGATASFIYEGDGARVKGTVGGVTTAYIGDWLEWTGSTSTMKRYYYAGGARVAMRDGATLYYLLGDHLGITSLATDSLGNRISELRYKAWGEIRYTYGTTPTKRHFTG